MTDDRSRFTDGLTSTAFLPWSGGLAQIFGRRAVLVSSIVIFAIGSALCGASQNMTMLIASRSVQGVGCGGILSLSEIIIADLGPCSSFRFSHDLT